MNQRLKSLNKTRILIGSILFTLLPLISIQLYKNAIDFESFHNIEMTFGRTMKLLYYTRSFINPLVIVLAIVGFFITKPIGWILINNIFAYFFAFLCLILIPSGNGEWYLYLLGLISLSFIALNNGKKTLDFYKIEKTNLMIYNLVVILLGMGFAFLWGYFYLHEGDNIFKIIYGR